MTLKITAINFMIFSRFGMSFIAARMCSLGELPL